MNRFIASTTCRQVALLVVVAIGLFALTVGSPAVAGPDPASVTAQAPVVPGGDPEGDVQRILEDPAYDGVTGTTIAERLREFWDWLRDAFEGAFFGTPDAPGLGWAGILLLALLVAGMAWGVVRGGRRTGHDRRVARAVAAAPIGPDDHERLARAAADRGDLDAAVHHAFRALAIRHGILVHRPDQPGRTAGEVRRAAAGTMNGAVVAAATDAFELVAYGGRPASADDLARIDTANHALRVTVGRSPQVAS